MIGKKARELSCDSFSTFNLRRQTKQNKIENKHKHLCAINDRVWKSIYVQKMDILLNVFIICMAFDVKSKMLVEFWVCCAVCTVYTYHNAAPFYLLIFDHVNLYAHFNYGPVYFCINSFFRSYLTCNFRNEVFLLSIGWIFLIIVVFTIYLSQCCSLCFS